MAWQRCSHILLVFFGLIVGANVETIGDVGFFVGGVGFEREGFGIGGGGKVDVLHLLEGLPLVLDGSD